MSESIKPDYCLSFKRKWFAKIWNGEKTVEYRTVTPKYKRLATWIGKTRGVFMMFYFGMTKTGPRMLVQVSKIDMANVRSKVLTVIITAFASMSFNRIFTTTGFIPQCLKCQR